jgi:DNA-directed RNA polymerase I, II, and III subunit RPABC4
MSSYDQTQTTSGAANPHTQAAQLLGIPVPDTAKAVEYTCGDCDMTVSLKRGEPIRCRSCGHRVLYKQRTNRYV